MKAQRRVGKIKQWVRDMFLHMANTVSIPHIPNGTQTTPGVIPNCRSKAGCGSLSPKCLPSVFPKSMTPMLDTGKVGQSGLRCSQKAAVFSSFLKKNEQ